MASDRNLIAAKLATSPAILPIAEVQHGKDQKFKGHSRKTTGLVWHGKRCCCCVRAGALHDAGQKPRRVCGASGRAGIAIGAVPETWSQTMITKPCKSAKPKSPAKRSVATKGPAVTKNTRRAKAPEPTPVIIATSKQQRCLDLLARRDGATLAELITATEWQPHSVRGFLSGTVKKKLGLTLNSSRDADGTRHYSLERLKRGQ